MLRRQASTCRDRGLAAGQVLAGEAAVGAALQPARQDHPALLEPHVLLHENRVKPRRHGRAREDAYCGARLWHLGEAARGGPSDNGQRRIDGLPQVGEAHRETVDGRVVEGRQIQRGRHVLCEHTAIGCADRQDFRAGDGRQPLADERPRRIDRHEFAAEGEAIVGELGHGSDRFDRRKLSSLKVTTSRPPARPAHGEALPRRARLQVGDDLV
jgi:hypothetical protein